MSFFWQNDYSFSEAGHTGFLLIIDVITYEFFLQRCDDLSMYIIVAFLGIAK